MGNPSPIRVPSDLGNVRTISDVVRFLAAFTGQVASQFNTLIANKDVYGVVGASGSVGVTGSGNFGASLLRAGTYFIAFREPYAFSPSVLVTPGTTAVLMNVYGVTTAGFSVFSTTVGNSTLVNAPFHFHAKGAR